MQSGGTRASLAEPLAWEKEEENEYVQISCIFSQY
jgi:hypothetical protein